MYQKSRGVMNTEQRYGCIVLEGVLDRLSKFNADGEEVNDRKKNQQ